MRGDALIERFTRSHREISSGLMFARTSSSLSAWRSMHATRVQRNEAAEKARRPLAALAVLTFDATHVGLVLLLSKEAWRGCVRCRP